MSLTVTDKGGGNFEPVPAGLHPAICQAIYDLGEQQTSYGMKDKVLISFELPTIRMDIDENGTARNIPRSISQQFTASLNSKANLRKTLEGWRGRPFTTEELEGFHLGKLVGLNCQVQVIHEPAKNDPTKIYGNLKAIVPASQGQEHQSELGLVTFEIGQQLPPNTPEWIEKIILKSTQMGGSQQDQQQQPQPHGYSNNQAPPQHYDTDQNGYQQGPTGYEEPTF